MTLNYLKFHQLVLFLEIHKKIVEVYKPESKINDIDNKSHLIDFFRLKKLVSIQDLLDIEDKNKIDIVKGKNDKPYIKESDYSKEINQIDYEQDYDDWVLEI